MSRRCRETRRVMAYVDGELSTGDAVRFDEHLEICARCRASVEAQRTLEDALVALPLPRLDAADRQRLHATIAARVAASAGEAPPRPRLSILRVSPFRRIVAAAAAAVVVACGLLGWQLWHPWHGPPTTGTAGTTIAAITTEPMTEPASEPVPAAPANASATNPPEAADVAASAPAAPPLAPPPAPVAAFETRTLPPTILVAARGEIARFLPTLADDSDPVASFVAAMRPVREAGIPIQQILLQLLRDDEPEVAVAAARLFAAAARSRILGPDEPALVPALEAGLRRPDRAAAMLEALIAVDSPRAWQAIVGATRQPRLRPAALAALAGREDPAAHALLLRELVEAQRAGETAVVTTALAAIRTIDGERVTLLAELLRAGVDAGTLRATLERDRAGALAALIGLLPGPGAGRRNALLLVPCLPDPALVAPLASLLARGDEAVAAAAALVSIGGDAACTAFARLAADPATSRSRARTIASAFEQLLDRATELSLTFELAFAALVDDEAGRRALVELVATASGSAGVRARVALLSDRTLPTADAVRLVDELLRRREPAEPADLFPILVRAAAMRDERRDGQLLASLLLLLYTNGGDAGLVAGVRALGLELTATREQRLCATARALARGPAGARDLARFDALLPLAP